MRLNIGHKIFGIAVIVLALMLAVAVYSVDRIAKISDDLETVATRHLPVTEIVARINVHVLEQGIVLQRLFTIAEEGEPGGAAAARGRDAMTIIGKSIVGEFIGARRLLKAEAAENNISRHAAEAAATLAKALNAIETEYLKFEAHAQLLLGAREASDRPGFDDLLSQMNARQDAIFNEIANLRRHVARMTDEAVARADHEERALLIANSVLTGLAAILAIGFSIIITRALVGSVRRLVAGTERIESGDLDTEVPVTTSDEVGSLTASFNDMVGGLRLKERIKDTFGKYMDPRIVSNLLDNPEFSEPGGERREMTVMFIDLKGFTTISERLEADQLVNTINGFFGHMTEAISANGGVVDKFMGDAVMAFWGPPFTGPDEHAALACKAAMGALDRLQVFRAEVAADLGDGAAELEIDLRIGISTGEMVVGTIGSTASRSFTVMGDPVNLGSRLEGANKAYGTLVMISERTRELAADEVAARELDLIRVKGKAEPTRVFELAGLASGPAALAAPAGDNFEAGLRAYRAQDWPAAAAAFEACLARRPDDAPSRIYLGRIEQLRDAPPPADWDGVWVFDTK